MISASFDVRKKHTKQSTGKFNVMKTNNVGLCKLMCF